MSPHLLLNYRFFVAGLVLILNHTFCVSPLQSQPGVELAFDDGTFEQFVGFNNGQGILANGPFVPPSFPATLTEVRFQTNGFDAGVEVAINIYVDSTGQADRPEIGILVGSVRTTLGTGGQFQSVDVSNLGVTLSGGNFFIGVEHVVADVNIGLGLDNEGRPDRAWFDSNLDGIFSPRSSPGVYAIRAIVSGGNGPGSTAIGTLVYHQITSFNENPMATQGWQHVLSDNGGHVVWYTQADPKRVFTAKADGSNILQVAGPADRLTSVDISADGSRIAYLGGAFTSRVQVNSINADGSDDRALLTLSGFDIGTLRITGNGNKIFFSVWRDSRTVEGNDLVERGIYSINSDGSSLQQLVGPANIAGLLGIAANDVVAFGAFTNGPELDVPFDGARFIFVAATMQTGERHIFTANGNGSGLQRIFGPIPANPIEVGMSSNGEKVAFITRTVTGNREGYTSNFDGAQRLKIASNEQFRFTGDFGNDVGEQISLTANGSKVIFNGKFGHLFNSDGSGVVQLTADAEASGNPNLITGSLARATMSSDGRRILFSFTAPGTGFSQLAVLDINPISLGEAPALTNITINPNVVAVNHASNATIRAKVNPANTVTYVANVALLNGLRDNKITRQILSDDGSFGDEVSGDGIFTHNGIQAFADAELGPRILRINAEVFSADGRLHGTAVAVEPFAVVQNPPVSVETPAGNIPNNFSLSQNYPNPFNPETHILFNLPHGTRVNLQIFNLLGQKIRTLVDGQKTAGSYTVIWDGRIDSGQQAASGVYLYRLRAGNFIQNRKMILMR